MGLRRERGARQAAGAPKSRPRGIVGDRGVQHRIAPPRGVHAPSTRRHITFALRKKSNHPPHAGEAYRPRAHTHARAHACVCACDNASFLYRSAHFFSFARVDGRFKLKRWREVWCGGWREGWARIALPGRASDSPERSAGHLARIEIRGDHSAKSQFESHVVARVDLSHPTREGKWIRPTRRPAYRR